MVFSEDQYQQLQHFPASRWHDVESLWRMLPAALSFQLQMSKEKGEMISILMET